MKRRRSRWDGHDLHGLAYTDRDVGATDGTLCWRLLDLWKNSFEHKYGFWARRMASIAGILPECISPGVNDLRRIAIIEMISSFIAYKTPLSVMKLPILSDFCCSKIFLVLSWAALWLFADFGVANKNHRI